ncbi:hypothetical protein HK096_007430, partial [Nowakowskiella sp. JEL0078]
MTTHMIDISKSKSFEFLTPSISEITATQTLKPVSLQQRVFINSITGQHCEENFDDYLLQDEVSGNPENSDHSTKNHCCIQTIETMNESPTMFPQFCEKQDGLIDRLIFHPVHSCTSPNVGVVDRVMSENSQRQGSFKKKETINRKRRLDDYTFDDQNEKKIPHSLFSSRILSLEKSNISSNSSSPLLTPRFSTEIELKDYFSTSVSEIIVRGVRVLKRNLDGFINATQLLRAAGIQREKRNFIILND